MCLRLFLDIVSALYGHYTCLLSGSFASTCGSIRLGSSPAEIHSHYRWFASSCFGGFSYGDFAQLGESGHFASTSGHFASWTSTSWMLRHWCHRWILHQGWILRLLWILPLVGDFASVRRKWTLRQLQGSLRLCAFHLCFAISAIDGSFA